MLAMKIAPLQYRMRRHHRYQTKKAAMSTASARVHNLMEGVTGG
jgi:hypothetical protein